MTHDQQVALSTRGLEQAATGKEFERLEEIASDLYHPQHNPNGVVNMGIAENTLLHKELAGFFESHFHLAYDDFSYGTSLKGNPRLRNALANLLNTRFNPHMPVTSDHIVVGAGTVPVISELAGILANPGDGILLTAPYYHGFNLGLAIRKGIVPVGVSMPLTDMFTVSELGYFEESLEESNRNGINIKAVILCNPHNPLGRPYPKDVIVEYCKFCEKHDLHLISDEIYGLSVFPSRDIPHPEPFSSALSLDLRSYGINPSRLHVLYGMSKDFNCNGFRVGALISQHHALLVQSMTTSAFFILAASPSAALWCTLLSDQSFFSQFLETNRHKLQEAYDHVTSWLRFHNIPYIPSSAGHFLMIDVRSILSDTPRYGSLLPISSEQCMRERETAFFHFLIEGGVWLTPGAMCHMEPGWFRLTFSLGRDYINVALVRIENAFGWEKWPELE